jgi:hypothetical protein
VSGLSVLPPASERSPRGKLLRAARTTHPRCPLVRGTGCNLAPETGQPNLFRLLRRRGFGTTARWEFSSAPSPSTPCAGAGVRACVTCASASGRAGLAGAGPERRPDHRRLPRTDRRRHPRLSGLRRRARVARSPAGHGCVKRLLDENLSRRRRSRAGFRAALKCPC